MGAINRAQIQPPKNRISGTAARSRTSYPSVRATKRAASEPSARRTLLDQAAEAVRLLGKGIATAGICGTLLTATPQCEAREIRFPASGDPEVFTVQKTIVEAWEIVRDSFVDGDGGSKWEKQLGKSLTAAYNSSNGKEAYGTIKSMLDATGDPYTRIIPPEEYADFRVKSDGELQGVGLLIASDPTSGKLVVLSPIKGGPADRAGIRSGDELLSINGLSTQGLNGPEAAKVLRGQNGTSVSVKFSRRTDQIPGVPGKPEKIPELKTKSVRLRREVVELSPVFYSKVNEAGEDLGYIKLANFSNKAASAVREAIADLEQQGVQGYILDLRNNPGGLVDAGLDVARLWLDGSPTIFNVSARGSENMRSIRLPEGVAITDLPLAVVVNQDSASASEILAGALKDNHRATLIGDRTYGKGKIQNVFELDDGSALLVTVARYKTPADHSIDVVGIKTDIACVPNAVSPPPKGEGNGVRGPGTLRSKTMMEVDLEADDCFLTAERMLYKNSHKL